MIPALVTIAILLAIACALVCWADNYSAGQEDEEED